MFEGAPVQNITEDAKALKHIQKNLPVLFRLPVLEVCKQLNVKPATLKLLCRNYGISRWPYRKLKSLEYHIEKKTAEVHAEGVDFVTQMRLRAELSELHRKRTFLLERPQLAHPNPNITSTFNGRKTVWHSLSPANYSLVEYAAETETRLSNPSPHPHFNGHQYPSPFPPSSSSSSSSFPSSSSSLLPSFSSAPIARQTLKSSTGSQPVSEDTAHATCTTAFSQSNSTSSLSSGGSSSSSSNSSSSHQDSPSPKVEHLFTPPSADSVSPLHHHQQHQQHQQHCQQFQHVPPSSSHYDRFEDSKEEDGDFPPHTAPPRYPPHPSHPHQLYSYPPQYPHQPPHQPPPPPQQHHHHHYYPQHDQEHHRQQQHREQFYPQHHEPRHRPIPYGSEYPQDQFLNSRPLPLPLPPPPFSSSHYRFPAAPPPSHLPPQALFSSPDEMPRRLSPFPSRPVHERQDTRDLPYDEDHHHHHQHQRQQPQQQLQPVGRPSVLSVPAQLPGKIWVGDKSLPRPTFYPYQPPGTEESSLPSGVAKPSDPRLSLNFITSSSSP